VKLLIINGPNLNRLGERDPALYGTMTLAELEQRIGARAAELGAETSCFQSNHEGALVDWLQANGPSASGVVINPAALTTYGLSLRDCLLDLGVPTVEVHLSHIHAREPWRRDSVIAPVCVAQVTGMGWRGYLAAVDYLVAITNKEGGV
jgi:3-dehydroquinate dehydratase-2